jgi:hypothetical protein
MRTVFGLALRQTEGLIGSIVALLGLALAVPDHSTLSRRSKTLEVPPLRRLAAGPLLTPLPRRAVRDWEYSNDRLP